MSTHNLCFRAKIRKNVYPCTPQFYYIKVGCKGVYITRTCFHDVIQLAVSVATTVNFTGSFTLCLFIILLVRFGLLSGHLLGNSCLLGWPYVLSHCLLYICIFHLFPILVLRAGFGF